MSGAGSVLPAHAGMILSPGILSRIALSAPRARGDDPGKVAVRFQEVKCSPRTRG